MVGGGYGIEDDVAWHVNDAEAELYIYLAFVLKGLHAPESYAYAKEHEKHKKVAAKSYHPQPSDYQEVQNQNHREGFFLKYLERL